MDFYSLSVGRRIVEVELILKLAKSPSFYKKSPNILYKINPSPSLWHISNVTLSQPLPKILHSYQCPFLDSWHSVLNNYNGISKDTVMICLKFSFLPLFTPFPSPGDLPNPRIKPASPASLLQCRQFLYHWASREATKQMLKGS